MVVAVSMTITVMVQFKLLLYEWYDNDYGDDNSIMIIMNVTNLQTNITKS